MTDSNEINPNNERPNALQVFDYGQHQVRTVLIDGSVWFVGRDVARILGYSNPQKAVRDHSKKYHHVGVNETFTPLAFDPQTLIIPESDVYRLVMRSKLPDAETFQDWVVEEVIPTIRKTGSYEVDPVKKLKAPTDSYLTSKLYGAAEMAHFFGMDGNQARISANHTVHKTYGVNCMENLQITHLDQEEQEIHLNVSDLGKKLGLSPQKTNQLLETCELQVSSRNSKNKLIWSPTETGRRFCVIKDTMKKKGNGTPITQMFWKESTVEFCREYLRKRPIMNERLTGNTGGDAIDLQEFLGNEAFLKVAGAVR